MSQEVYDVSEVTHDVVPLEIAPNSEVIFTTEYYQAKVSTFEAVADLDPCSMCCFCGIDMDRKLGAVMCAHLACQSNERSDEKNIAFELLSEAEI